jgi:hypothetical protein
LTLVSSKRTKKVFLTTNTKVGEAYGKIDLIISPEFYWVRKFEIPVKTQNQAKQVLPMLFDEYISASEDALNYQAIKLENNSFLCFAYSNKKIYEAIKKANIPLSNISSFYFAQNECKDLKSFEIDSQTYVYTEDEILIKIPNNLVEEPIYLKNRLEKISLSSNKIQVKLYNEILGKKQYIFLSIIFLVLILANGVKYFSYSNEINKLNEELESVKKTYRLPSSMIQMNSILKKYKKATTKELKKREAISYIFSNPDFLNSLNMERESISLEYKTKDKRKIEEFLSKKFKIVSSRFDLGLLKVRVKI